MFKNRTVTRSRFWTMGSAVISTMFFVIIMMGCSVKHTYEWGEYRIEASRIINPHEFSKENSVSIVNVQPNDTPFCFYSFKPNMFYSSLSQLTAAIVTQLKTELRKHKTTAGPDTSKSIRIRVDSINYKQEPWGQTKTADLSVHLQAGDGYVKEIHVTNVTPALSLNHVVDGVIALAVIEILNSPEVRAYLQE